MIQQAVKRIKNIRFDCTQNSGRVNSAGVFALWAGAKGYEKSINSLAIFRSDAILGEYGGTEDDY